MAKKKPKNPGSDLPQGLNNLLMKTPEARKGFEAMEETERNEILAQAAQVGSRREMEAIVSRIAEKGAMKQEG